MNVAVGECDQEAWWKEATPTSAPHIHPWEQHQQPSTFWKNIKTLEHIFSSLVRFQLGKGDTVRFWHDNWSLRILQF
jgi:hypothetical protein